MKCIEVTQSNTSPSQGSAVGVYLVGNDLHVIATHGSWPFVIAGGAHLAREVEPKSANNSSGFSEDAVLKLIAITIDPKRHKDLIR